MISLTDLQYWENQIIQACPKAFNLWLNNYDRSNPIFMSWLNQSFKKFDSRTAIANIAMAFLYLTETPPKTPEEMQDIQDAIVKVGSPDNTAYVLWGEMFQEAQPHANNFLQHYFKRYPKSSVYVALLLVTFLLEKEKLEENQIA